MKKKCFVQVTSFLCMFIFIYFPFTLFAQVLSSTFDKLKTNVFGKPTLVPVHCDTGA